MTIAPIVINPINDVVVASNAPGTTFNLLSHFDDPATTGKVAQFQLYNQLGNSLINVLLFDQAGAGAPLTVENFLKYVNDGDYVNSIIHRSDPGFVIQGGGFTVNQLNIATIPTDPPIQNEYSPARPNLRGTIAMAKQGGNPNSATSQWFFNLDDDNAQILNELNNGGFTVFGEVLSDADLITIDAIATVPIFDRRDVNSAFRELPLQINPPQSDNDLVRFSNIAVSQLNELQFTVIGNTNPNLVNISVNGLALQVDYQPNQVGTAAITIQATNLLGEQITDTFTLTVFDPVFDPAQYGASHLDLIQVYGYNLDAFTQHYLTTGQAEGRSLDTFDEKSYLASYDDLLNTFGTDSQAATEHYIRTVLTEGRPITFNATQYLASHDDLIFAFGNNPEAAKDHFIQSYATEKRARDTFKEDIYLASWKDLIATYGYNLEAATQHYINSGAAEKRVKEVFDPVTYLNKYPDLKDAFGDNLTAATTHYVTTGYPIEGRS